MKTTIVFLLFVLLTCGVAYAASYATDETGDTRAVPMVLYATTTSDTLVAVLCDEDGKLITTT